MKKISFILLLLSISLFIGVYYVSKREAKRIQFRKQEQEFNSVVSENKKMIRLIEIELKRIQDSIQIEQIKLLK